MTRLTSIGYQLSHDIPMTHNITRSLIFKLNNPVKVNRRMQLNFSQFEPCQLSRVVFLATPTYYAV